jgi:tRNA pseudouridine38-40 synthase
MPNLKLTLSYEGTRYNGWQKQGNTPRTIQEKLESALTEITGKLVEIAGSGRTDAGVHAREQTASFRTGSKLLCGEILEELRKRLPEDIGAISLEMAHPRFHARLSCVEKTYVYRVWNSGSPNVFERRVMAAVKESLDIQAMRAAAAALVGTHDFSAFCANRHLKKSAVRTLSALTIERLGDEVRLTLTGDGFLYNMARILTGTLLEVGKGALDPKDIPIILASLDRAKAGPAAPAQGLILYEVRY